MNRTVPPAFLIVIALATFSPAQAQAETQGQGTLPRDWVSSMQWRSIGPTNMSGRIVAFSVVEDRPSTYWVATAAGGLLKTTNNGITFEHQFEHGNTFSLGDVCHAPSNPDIVWLGTGEQNPIRSMSYGDGVYKSIDGGKSWSHQGLKKSFQISRIAIHPTNPDIVYVGAQGRLYGPNEERGLYKTTDAGRTFDKILHIDDKTGVIDVKMHPRQPDTLLVFTYARQRDAYDGGSIPQSTGPGAKLWKTTDGGKTFRHITKGLPTVELDRSGLSYCLSNPDVVYAVIACKRARSTRGQRSGRGGGGSSGPSGVYRSSDGGESWQRQSGRIGSPAYFYGKIYADPVDEDRVYLLSIRTTVSTDGGKTFGSVGRGPHADNHAMWIDPKNNQHLLMGNDGGVYLTYDRTRTWQHLNNNALGTFYHVAVDNRPVYWVYGGLQDNGTWAGPNRTRSGGTISEDWLHIGGGDGFVTFAHPDHPHIVFSESQNGNMSRRDLRTNRSTRIRPPRDAGRVRFNWKTPMMLSHHDHDRFYCAGNRVFRSNKLGDDLETISEELTLTERGAATALGEDRFDEQTLYVGTEDGALWVTRDGGEKWTELHRKFPGVKGPRWVASIETSAFARGRVYVTLDAHRSDDDQPYALVSEDFGETWKNITANLPWGSTRTLREDAVNADVLYVGHEFGVHASIDRGASWTRINNNLPTVAIHEIAVHPTAGEIVVGTHGRSFWILDVVALRQASAKTVAAKAHLFEPGKLVKWRSSPRRGTKGLHGFRGENPPSGTPVLFSLTEPAEKVSLQIVDSAGKVVRDLRIRNGNEPGLHKVVWDGAANPSSRGVANAGARGQRGGERGGQRGGGRGTGRGGTRFSGRGGSRRRRGTPVANGTYSVVLTIDGHKLETKVQVVDDPEPLKD